MATTDLHFVSGALQPVHRGVRFLGGNVDDGIQVDAAAAAIVAGNHTIGTITAWIMVPDNTGTYTIFGAGDANAAEYMHFSVEAGTLWAVIYDGGAAQFDVNTAAGTIKPHKWHHVALVQDGKGVQFYIDGELSTRVDTTATDLGQWFDDTDGIDGAHIGAADSIAGDAALTQEFKGYISDVRIWSGTTAANALTQAQIKLVMKGGSVGTPHNWWTLDQTLVDAGSGADNGTAVGDIIYSDANEFASRMTFLETVPLTADNVTIMADNGVGYGYAILAA